MIIVGSLPKELVSEVLDGQKRSNTTVYSEECCSRTSSLTHRPIQGGILVLLPRFPGIPSCPLLCPGALLDSKTNHAVGKAPLRRQASRKGERTPRSKPLPPSSAPPPLFPPPTARRDDPAPLHGARSGGCRGGDSALQDAAAEACRARARPPQAGARARHGAHRGGHCSRRARVQPPQHGPDPRPLRGGDRRRRGRGAHPHRPSPPRATHPRGLAHGYVRAASDSLAHSPRFNSIHHLECRGGCVSEASEFGGRKNWSCCTIQEHRILFWNISLAVPRTATYCDNAYQNFHLWCP